MLTTLPDEAAAVEPARGAGVDAAVQDPDGRPGPRDLGEAVVVEIAEDQRVVQARVEDGVDVAGVHPAVRGLGVDDRGDRAVRRAQLDVVTAVRASAIGVEGHRLVRQHGELMAEAGELVE